ncbi:formylglycine-generating enzyme family protein [Gimesia algae]|uniref:Serine/threonine-protein kinase pkn1 n=1 Tax=Gimesia algae TaxID=2527971 RepID=A0A517VGI7_9PLAN|nr:SUMF1/EgtB/PvdO family nonheme iron enzyme [Gimesia algae]QDT92095.1 Serine/threonine-protein kinase pkn1 [Gimesia algae]
MIRNCQFNEKVCAVVAGFSLLFLVGCGGGSDPVKQQSQPPRQAAGSSTNMRAPTLKPTGVKPTSKKTVNKTQTVPEGNPDDLFEVVDYVHNFEIQKPDPAGQSEDEFVALLPAGAGVNASSFSIVKSGTEAEPHQPDPSFKLPEGFTAIKEAGYSQQGLPNRIRCDLDYSEMVLVPAGVSVQGVVAGDANAKPQFSVYQDAFYIDVHEVTLEQYRRWRSEMIAKKGKVPEPAGNDSQPSNLPAMGISYTDALNYSRSMNKQLPRETQWEKAARGEQGFTYPWGSGRPLWQVTRQPGQIDPVATFSGDRSPYGVYDMAGNAREWCDDWYSKNAYQAALALSDAGVVRDWMGPRRAVEPSMRVVRGNQKSWEVWKRTGENMRTPPADVGFRCVLNLKSASATPEKTKSGSTF